MNNSYSAYGKRYRTKKRGIRAHLHSCKILHKILHSYSENKDSGGSRCLAILIVRMQADTATKHLGCYTGMLPTVARKQVQIYTCA